MNPNFISEEEFAAMTKRVGGSVAIGGKAEKPVIHRRTRNEGNRIEVRQSPVSNPASPPTFTVHGVAMGKPRMTQQDKWKQRPAVVRYRAWCDLVRFAAGIPDKMTLTQGVRLSVTVYLPFPQSWSQKKREHYYGQPHLGKPDIDNIAKGLMDALFVNDSYVWTLDVMKYWDNRLGPYVTIRMEA